MTETQMLLIKLMEECNEVSQRAAKLLRFGASEVQAGQEKTNLERLADEMKDLDIVRDLLADRGIPLPHLQPSQEWSAKFDRVMKYLQYSRELGILKDE